MTWNVICPDGVSRHAESFPTRRAAAQWTTWRHTWHPSCTGRKHSYRRVGQRELEPAIMIDLTDEAALAPAAPSELPWAVV